MPIELLIKATLFTRPNAKREAMFVAVPFTDIRRQKYEALSKAGGRFTWESGGQLGDKIIVCIENDDMDFEQRIAKDRAEAEQRVVQMLDAWTPELWQGFLDSLAGDDDDGPGEHEIQGN